jgi:sialate O-acetylesterase
VLRVGPLSFHMTLFDISRSLSRPLGQHARRLSIAISIFFWVTLPVSWADPVLPHLIGDHMVLQRGREIHIWGSADAGENIIVTLTGNTSSIKTDSAGHWSVHLPPMPAGGPFTLMIQGKKTITLKDVMIGEVWVASGQSNMAFALSGSVNGSEEVARADYPQIRLFNVPKKIALQPQQNTLPATWQICSPESAKDFSAVGYYFARDLYKNLGVPIAVIESAWPGTAIEEWIDADAFRQDSRLKHILDDAPKSEGEALAGTRVPVDLEVDDFELLRGNAANETAFPFSNFDDGSTHNATGGNWGYYWQGAPDTAFELVAPGRGGKGFAARISGAMDESDDSRVTARFKLDGSPMDLTSYSGLRFWARGNGQFRLRTLQPTITDWDDYSTSLFQATADWQRITIWFRDLRQEGWGVNLPFTQSALTGFSIESLTTVGYPPRPASGLFEGMIAPLLAYPFRGVIWYQGEGNALKAHQYRTLLPALITSWRKASHQNSLAFLIVQLPNHGAVPEQPTESAWAELREAQLLAARQLPDTGIAVTIDVGDPKDLHPHRKAEVGGRLALLALGTTYGKPIVYSGPLYQGMEIQGSQIRIRFASVGTGLEANRGMPLRGFAIAGADKTFHWADASIEGDSVVVSSSQVPAPVAVRYAWADSPPCNLFNKEGLPASPFRTDDWRGITEK